jgi:hypothetical protein
MNPVIVRTLSPVLTIAGGYYMYTGSWSVCDDFGLAAVYAVLIGILRHLLCNGILRDIAVEMLGKKSVKVGAIDKFTSCAFKSLFFFLMVLYEYWVLSGRDFLPPVLIGSGSADNLWTTSGFTPTSDLVNLYMVNLGYHMHSAFFHLFLVKRRSDFHEMVLHHVVTLWLIVLSYVENQTRIGSVIMFMNDLPDIFVYLTKVFGETEYVNTSLVSYLSLVVTFFHFRIVSFEFSVFPSLLRDGLNKGIEKYAIYIVLLLVLHGLQLYWFSLIVKIGLNIARDGDRGDIQSTAHQ